MNTSVLDYVVSLLLHHRAPNVTPNVTPTTPGVTSIRHSRRASCHQILAWTVVNWRDWAWTPTLLPMYTQMSGWCRRIKALRRFSVGKSSGDLTRTSRSLPPLFPLGYRIALVVRRHARWLEDEEVWWTSIVHRSSGQSSVVFTLSGWMQWGPLPYLSDTIHSVSFRYYSFIQSIFGDSLHNFFFFKVKAGLLTGFSFYSHSLIQSNSLWRFSPRSSTPQFSNGHLPTGRAGLSACSIPNN